SLCGVEASATVLLLQGEELALDGKIDEAIPKFEKALELDPSLEFDPQAKAIKMAAPFFVSEGMGLADQGKVDEALASYNKAQELDPKLEISANSWNELCWYGSLYNQADKVMFACEKAIELTPDHGGRIDSRGLARALTGNIKGAIEDFEVFIAWTDNETKKAQRQGWVDALKKGENPFTTEVLESLR
ncbi:MAG: tetratricopeptide repeat protein, partial [Moorea sp. SIO3I7]|nr:tetratricopeptide repeat protein [Moorena sp. SIO3I7]